MKRIILVLMFSTLLIGCGNNHSFDSATWLKSDTRARGRMSESLVSGKTLVGQSAEEAQRQLGLPEKDWGSAWQYQIDLGWPMKDSKHYGLQVHLDNERKVSLVKIVD